jgi:catechol 2,3-dioxygenase
MNVSSDWKRSRVSEARETVSGARIGHVNLRVTDMDRAISFYCDVLGLYVVYCGPSIGVPTVSTTNNWTNLMW